MPADGPPEGWLPSLTDDRSFTATTSFTQQDVNDGAVWYRHFGTGSSGDSFLFQVSADAPCPQRTSFTHAFVLAPGSWNEKIMFEFKAFYTFIQVTDLRKKPLTPAGRAYSSIKALSTVSYCFVYKTETKKAAPSKLKVNRKPTRTITDFFFYYEVVAKQNHQVSKLKVNKMQMH